MKKRILILLVTSIFGSFAIAQIKQALFREQKWQMPIVCFSSFGIHWYNR